MQSRYPLPDAARGLLIVLVVLHHALFDLDAFFGVPVPLLASPGFQRVRVCFAGAFFVLSGVSCAFSSDPLRRGAQTLAAGCLLTVATGLFLPGQLIRFGVLHCLGACRILWVLFGKKAAAAHPRLFSALCGYGLLACGRLSQGVLLLPPFGKFFVPEIAGLGWLGFPDPSYQSADLFPLLPWAGVYLLGGALGERLRRADFPKWLGLDPCPALSFLGRHTLTVYLLHQPVLFLLLSFACGWPSS